jgi:hypothetical protein
MCTESINNRRDYQPLSNNAQRNTGHTTPHQPIIMKQQTSQQPLSTINNNLTSMQQSNTPQSTAGMALATALGITTSTNKSSQLNSNSYSINSNTNNKPLSNIPNTNAKMNNSLDYTTPIGITSSSIYQSPSHDMDLFQQNDSGILVNSNNTTNNNSTINTNVSFGNNNQV